MSPSRRIEIIAPSRIHVSLACMGDNSFRHNGGAGFAISGFDTIISVVPSEVFMIRVGGNVKLTASLKLKVKELERYLDQLCRGKGLRPLDIEIIRMPPRNSGFGTGTTLELSCIEAIYFLNEVDYHPSDIIYSSRRGGTSGVGVHTYFEGGFVVDLGRKPTSELLPSSYGRGSHEPPVKLGRWGLPDWPIGIALPKENDRKNKNISELEFFRNNSNLSLKDISEISFLMLFGLVPAVIENDIQKFSQAINCLQSTKWKAAEIEQYGDALVEVRDKIISNGALGAGVSSLGPLVYFFVFEKNVDKFKNISSSQIKIVAPDNCGRRILKC